MPTFCVFVLKNRVMQRSFHDKSRVNLWPFSVFPQEGICQCDQLRHHGDEGDFFRLSCFDKAVLRNPLGLHCIAWQPRKACRGHCVQELFPLDTGDTLKRSGLVTVLFCVVEYLSSITRRQNHEQITQ